MSAASLTAIARDDGGFTAVWTGLDEGFRANLSRRKLSSPLLLAGLVGREATGEEEAVGREATGEEEAIGREATGEEEGIVVTVRGKDGSEDPHVLLRAEDVTVDVLGSDHVSDKRRGLL